MSLDLLRKLKANPKNPRTISDKDYEKLKRSIKEFPGMLELRPIVYDEEFIVLGGNMRLRAVTELAEKGFVVKPEYLKAAKDLTEAQKREFVIKDNIPSGDWDKAILAESWSDLPLADWGLAKSLWEKKEVYEDEPPSVNGTTPLSELGKVYQLGKHRLLCGDSTDLSLMEQLMNGKKADMVFTDPPYNVNYEGKAGKIKNDDFKTNQEFYQFLKDSISSLEPYVLGDVYICMSSSELHTLQKAFADCGGHWSTFIIWVKDRFTLGRSNYHRQYEPILYGWFKKSSHWWSGSRKLADVYKGEPVVDGMGKPMLYAEGLNTDVWEFDRPDSSKEHPTMKPVKLCAQAVENSCPEDGIVLDTFGGSGSTLIACEQLGRVCHIAELDQKYADVIRRRYWKLVNNNNEDGWEAGTPAVES